MSTRDAHLKLQGMSCANCASTIRESVGALDGVEAATANYATDEGTVTYDPERVSLAEIHAAVEEAGYEAVSETVTVGITDMSCANCAESNETALLDTPGVLAADVNFATDEARVRYNPADASLADIHDAIERAGYTPIRENDGDAESSEAGERSGRARRDAARSGEIRRQRRLTLLGAALSLPLLGMLAGHVFAPEWMETTFAGVPLGWIAFALATPVQVILGREFYENAYTAVVNNRTANMDVLIALGSSTAYVYSVARLLGFPGEGLYFDTAALILVFITLGNYLEARSRARPPRRSGACWRWRPRRRPLSGTTAPRRRSPSKTSRSVTASESGPARGSPPTRSSSTARARSTSRWSPASPSPSRRNPATR